MSKKQSTALMLNTVPDSIKTLEEKIAKLKHISESVYITSVIPMGFNKPVKDELDKGTLVKMMASIAAKEDAYNKASDRLGFKTVPVFKADGHSVSDWEHDIKLRFDVIDNKSRLDELNAIKKELEQMMSDNDRLAMIQDRIKNLA
jgi:hypothetical protein